MAVGFAVTIAIAVFFLVMGVYALAAPAALIRPFGVTLETPTSRSEIRAVYGGFGLAIAAVLGVRGVSRRRRAEGDPDHRRRRTGGNGVGPRRVRAGGCANSVLPNWFYFIVEAIAAAALFSVA